MVDVSFTAPLLSGFLAAYTVFAALAFVVSFVRRWL